VERLPPGGTDGGMRNERKNASSPDVCADQRGLFILAWSFVPIREIESRMIARLLPIVPAGAPIAKMQDFEDVWNSPLLQAIRRKLLRGTFHHYCLKSPACSDRTQIETRTEPADSPARHASALAFLAESQRDDGRGPLGLATFQGGSGAPAERLAGQLNAPAREFI
jgi:hypothetical protein